MKERSMLMKTSKIFLSSMKIKFVIMVLLTLYTVGVNSQCHRNCNQNGECDFWGRCHCFEGYEGLDCSSRSCPKGKGFADIAHGTDAAHRDITCSGRGTCISATGQCKCIDGYYGTDCGQSKCPKGCNNHGKCLSLRDSATQYDGFALNYSTVYNLWDADIIYGCICDPGWEGYDCSEQTCEVGVDPRVSTSSNEVVSMVCECSGTIEETCFGKFKLQFLGHVLDSWFHPFNRFVGNVVSGERTLTITDISFGKLSVGQTISGTGIPDGTTIVSQKTITGLRRSAVVICSTTATSTTLTVTHLATGAIAVGNIVTGPGIASDTTITAFGTGAGGVGTYTLSNPATATATLVSISTYNYGRGSTTGGGGKGTYEISADASSTETAITVTSYTIASEISTAITNSVSNFFGPSSSIFVTATASGGSTVAATGASSTPSSSASICAASQTTTTAISFQRQANDMPSLAFYSNRLPADSLYFTSTQSITCDCGGRYQVSLTGGSNVMTVDTVNSGSLKLNFEVVGTNIPAGTRILAFGTATGGTGTYILSESALSTSSVEVISECSGHFHVVFDGEVGSKLSYTATAQDLVADMNNLRTIKAAKALVWTDSSLSLCDIRNSRSSSIYVKSPAGNLPRPSLWSSVFSIGTGKFVSSYESMLTWAFSDGRDSTIKECNGIGKCNKDTKNCTCPFGWESDFDFGPCGKLTVNTSDFLGVGRCPGSIKYEDFASTATTTVRSIDDVPNYHDLAFVSFNPDPVADVIASGTGTSLTVSAVVSGVLNIGDLVYGPNIVDGTTISAASTASFTVTTTNLDTTITVAAVASGTLAVGYYLTGTNIPSDAYITALGSGNGGAGTYVISSAATGSGSGISATAVNKGVGTYTLSTAVSNAFNDRAVKSASKTVDAVVFASITSGVMTVTSSSSGTLKPYQYIDEGVIISSETYLGTYTMTTPATSAGTSATITAEGSFTFAGSWSGTTLTVTTATTGRISVGQTLSTAACGIDSDGNAACALSDTSILAYLTGNGGVGTYLLSKSQSLSATCTACATFSSMTLVGTWTSGSTSLTVNSITSVDDVMYHGLEQGDAISAAGISNSVMLARWSHAVFTATTRGTLEAVISCYWRGNVLTVFSKASGSVKVGQTLFGSEYLNNALYNYALSTYTSNTYITGILSATEGTYRVSQSQTVTSMTITVFVGGFVNAEVTGSISGTTLTVTAVSGSVGVTKNLAVGMFLRGPSNEILDGTEILEILDNTGGVGSYTLSETQNVRAGLYASQITLTATSKVLTVTSVTSGVIEMGQTVTGTGIADSTQISAVINGTNGEGTYAIDTAPNTPGSDISITATSTDLNVTTINSGTIGVGQVLSDTGSLMISGTSISAYATSATFRASVTSDSDIMNVLTMINGKIAVGQRVTGTGIRTDTFISTIDTGDGLNGTYTLTKTASSSETNIQMTTTSVGGVGVYTMSAYQAQTSRDVILNANTKISARNTYTYQLSDTSLTAAASSITAYSPTYKSLIDTYTWYPAEIPLFETSTRTLHTQLGSAFGAEKVLIDQGSGNLFYIDKVMTPYIGRKPLAAKVAVTTEWLVLSLSLDKSECEVYSFVMDAAMGDTRRKLFWSTSCTSNGKIWYASMDASSPSETALSASNGLASNLYTPKGLAVHYAQQKLYFIDGSKLNSCKFDGSTFTTVKILDVPFSYSASWSSPNSQVDTGSTLRVTSVNTAAVVTASISSTSNILTVSGVTSGTLGVGQGLSGTGIAPGAYILSLETGTGGIGDYVMSQNGLSDETDGTITAKSLVNLDSFIRANGMKRGTKIVRQLLGGIGQYLVSSTQTVASDTILTATSSASAIGRWSGYTLTITSVSSGTLMVGQTISGIGITTGTVIVKLGTGQGGAGTYIISKEHKNVIIPATITASSTVLTKGSIADNILTITDAQIGHKTVLASGVASWSGTTLTIESCTACNFAVGIILEGAGITGGEWSLVDSFDNSGLWTYTTITALGSGTGGAGTYTMSKAHAADGSSVSISGYTGGILAPSQSLSGTGIVGTCTISSQLPGGVGAYNMSDTQSAAAIVTADLTASSTDVVVSSVTSGQLKVNDEIYGTGIPSGTTISAVPAGGGDGTYTMSAAATSTASSVEISVVSTSGTVDSLFSGDFSDLKLNFAQNNTVNIVDRDRDVIAIISLKTTPSADILENPQFSGFSNGIFDIIYGGKSGTLKASWKGTVLTVVAVPFGKITVGAYLSGPGISKGTYIVAQTSGPAGLDGTYTLSQAQVADSPVLSYILDTQTTSSFVATWTAASASLTINHVISGGIAIGHYVSGPGIDDGSYIIAFVSGTYGGEGVYTLSTAQTEAGTLMNIGSQYQDRNPTLMLDDFRDIIGVVDSVYRRVYFYRYIVFQEDFYPFGHALTSSDGYGGVGVGVRTPVALSIDRGLSTPTFTSYLDCYGHGKCLGAAGNFACDCFDGWTGDCQIMTCPKGVSWFSEPVADNLAHDVLVECSNAGKCDRRTGQCQCAPGYEGSACERSQCGGQGTGYWDCSGRGRCFSMRELAEHSQDKFFSPVSYEYGSNPNIEQWDADMIHGCLPDSYGYFPANDITAAKSYASPSLRHVHNISKAVGAFLEEIQCPYSYDMRLEDNSSYVTSSAVVVGSWTATTLTVASVTSGTLQVGQKLTGTDLDANTYLIKFLSGTGGIGTYMISTDNVVPTDMYAHPGPLPQSQVGNSVTIIASIPTTMDFTKEVQTLTCSAIAGTFYLSFRGKTTSGLDASSCTGAQLKTELEKLRSIGTVSIEVVGGSVSSNVCGSSGVVSRITFETELGDLPLLVSSGISGAVFTASWNYHNEIQNFDENEIEVTAVASGSLAVNQILYSSSITAGTKILTLGDSTKGALGTYYVSSDHSSGGTDVSIIAASFVNADASDGSISGTTLTINTMTSGKFLVNSYIYGVGVAAGTYITALDSGTGTAGTYTINTSQTVSSTRIIGSGVAAIATTSEGSKNSLFECAGRGSCNRMTGTCGCWEQYVSSDGFGKNGSRGDCGHNVVY